MQKNIQSKLLTNKGILTDHGKSFGIAILQAAGLILLSLLDLNGTVVGVIYGVILVLFASYKSRRSRDLTRSPLYLLVAILVWDFLNLFFLRIPIWDALESVMFSLFPTLILGMLWLNVWTMRHSKFVYGICVLAIVFFMLLFFGYYLPIKDIGLGSHYFLD